MSTKDKVDKSNIPEHVAIIMDGNGRWAEQQGEMRIFGHSSGVESVRDSLVAARELGVKYLTLYAFSTENWNRPKKRGGCPYGFIGTNNCQRIKILK